MTCVVAYRAAPVMPCKPAAHLHHNTQYVCRVCCNVLLYLNGWSMLFGSKSGWNSNLFIFNFLLAFTVVHLFCESFQQLVLDRLSFQFINKQREAASIKALLNLTLLGHYSIKSWNCYIVLHELKHEWDFSPQNNQTLWFSLIYFHLEFISF